MRTERKRFSEVYVGQTIRLNGSLYVKTIPSIEAIPVEPPADEADNGPVWQPTGSVTNLTYVQVGTPTVDCRVRAYLDEDATVDVVYITEDQVSA